ncbi:MAG: BrnT family toxin [Acidobacteria bacterium]|nr:BrnT family toxin [Acidobacteriota bacterium]
MREYEWDPGKARRNLRKHGVGFADAVTIFSDENLAVIPDPGVEEEQRFVALGLDASGHLLAVVYTWRGENRIRIISARRASARERKQYGGLS